MFTLRILLALAVENNWSIHQLDVRSAFLKSKLDSEVYMKPLDGLSDYLEGQVCKLAKALYGLRQSPRCWNDCLNSCLVDLSFVRSQVDPCLYYTDVTFLLVWVDDLILLSGSNVEVQNVKKDLMSKLEIRDSTNKDKIVFLGIDICKSNNQITISHKMLIHKVFKHFNMRDCKYLKVPLQQKLDLKKCDNNSN